MRAVLVLPGDGIGPRATDDAASVLAESEHGSEDGTRRSGTLEVRTRVREVPE